MSSHITSLENVQRGTFYTAVSPASCLLCHNKPSSHATSCNLQLPAVAVSFILLIQGTCTCIQEPAPFCSTGLMSNSLFMMPSSILTRNAPIQPFQFQCCCWQYMMYLQIPNTNPIMFCHAVATFLLQILQLVGVADTCYLVDIRAWLLSCSGSSLKP